MKMINKITKLFKIFKSKLWIKGLLFGIPAYTELDKLISNIKTPESIIDIGSNKGQFILVIEKKFPNKEIFSFEPILELINKQKIFFKNKKNIKFFNVGLGNINQKKKFLITSRMDSSSFLSISNIGKKNEDYKVKEERIIKINKLDNFIDKDKLIRPVLMKIDVQGYELEVLKGALNILSKTDYIIAEVSKQEMYLNQATEEKIIDFLGNHGFKVKDYNEWTNIKHTNFSQRDLLFQKI